MDQIPLIFLQLLADKAFKPAAIALRFATDEAERLISAIADPNLVAFVKTATAQNLPCLLRTGAEPASELAEALAAIGIAPLKEREVHHTDESAPPQLPLTARWLSGDWSLAEPAKVSGKQTVSRALSLKLLQKVAEDADTCEIEAIFRQEPVLAYHLLRLVNSVGVGIGRTISSFSQAILILGRQQLKRWLNLMLFAANRDDHRSAMLLARVAVRARCMELLAKAGGLDRSVQEYAFMTGMFSLLGCLFGMPLTDVLKPLKLPPALGDALLRREGEIGLLLGIVEQSERADEDGLRDKLAQLGLAYADFNPLQLEAYEWMFGVIHEQDAGHA